jgi:hypothetical protein
MREKLAAVQNETEQETTKKIAKKQLQAVPTPQNAQGVPPAPKKRFEDMRDVVDDMQKTGEDRKWKFFA